MSLHVIVFVLLLPLLVVLAFIIWWTYRYIPHKRIAVAFFFSQVVCSCSQICVHIQWRHGVLFGGGPDDGGTEGPARGVGSAEIVGSGKGCRSPSLVFWENLKNINAETAHFHALLQTRICFNLQCMQKGTYERRGDKV